jgi:predicted RNA-binding Zn-ribbon protein involved in translation (DUF1610 family)
MNISTDWASFLTKVGAKRCPKCGEITVISAHIPDDPEDSDEGDRRKTPVKGGPLWYCFECGYEEPQVP